jgi:hypothetical protein
VGEGLVFCCVRAEGGQRRCVRDARYDFTPNYYGSKGFQMKILKQLLVSIFGKGKKSIYGEIQSPIDENVYKRNKKQAKVFFNWYINEIPTRVQILSDYVRSSPEFSSWQANLLVESLDDLGKWFCKQVETRPRSEEEISDIRKRAPALFDAVGIPQDELTGKTFSLAIDIGMYLSQIMQKNVKNAEWVLITKGRKSNNFNHPVLSTGGILKFNPTYLMVTYSYGIARGTKKPEGLRELYEIWKDILLDL